MDELVTAEAPADFLMKIETLKIKIESLVLIFGIFSELIMLVSCNTPLNVAWW